MSKKEELTARKIRQALKEGDVDFFVYSNDRYKNVKEVYRFHNGDGNECGKTYYFQDFDIYVNIEGWYSSYEGDEWEKVYESKPFEFSETRYKKK